MPPILAPLPRRISGKHSPFAPTEAFVVPVYPHPPHHRRGTLTVDVHCARPQVSLLEHNHSPRIYLHADDDEMDGRASPLDELLGILAKPTDAGEATYHRPGAPAPNGVPMMYTSTSSSAGTFSTTSPLSMSPLQLFPDYTVERERNKKHGRRSRGASLEPAISPYARPGPPKRLASLPYQQPDRRRSYTHLSPAALSYSPLDPLPEFRARGRPRSSCEGTSARELVSTLDQMQIRE